MKYTIGYNHRSSEEAASKREAVRAVRREASVQRRVPRVRRLSWAECADGLYCWLSGEDKRRDDTGARAFAVVSVQATNSEQAAE